MYKYGKDGFVSNNNKYCKDLFLFLWILIYSESCLVWEQHFDIMLVRRYSFTLNASFLLQVDIKSLRITVL